MTNIHEISGHFNVRFLSYDDLENSFESPKIVESEMDKYSPYAQLRKKESGESIVLELFGKRIVQLTIKEALFIMEPLNYKSKEYFKYNFNKCNDKRIQDIVSSQTNEILLKPLGINIEEIPENLNEIFSISNDLNERKKKTNYYYFEFSPNSLIQQNTDLFIDIPVEKLLEEIMASLNMIEIDFKKA